VVINFFASWCDPCREKCRSSMNLAAKAGGNYQVLGIAVGTTPRRGNRVCKRGQAGARSPSI
jgi:thiol-disulfide isomerase/thioredoxin